MEFTYDANQTGKAFPGRATRSRVGCSTMYLDRYLESVARDARIAFNYSLAQIRAKLAAIASKRDIASLLDPLEDTSTNVLDPSEAAIGKSVRIGLTRSVDREVRFYERSNPYVSGPKR